MLKGGKYSGGIGVKNNGNFKARIMNNRKSYGKSFQDKKDAEEWLRQKSEELGMFKNRYREVDDYLEVELQSGFIMKCDKQDLSLVERFIWHAKKDNNNNYCYGCEGQNKKHIFVLQGQDASVLCNCRLYLYLLAACPEKPNLKSPVRDVQVPAVR